MKSSMIDAKLDIEAQCPFLDNTHVSYVVKRDALVEFHTFIEILRIILIYDSTIYTHTHTWSVANRNP